MNKQIQAPPETWNDEQSMNRSFHLWFGWHRLEDQRRARDAFRRGWRSGAMKATVSMWKWIQRVLFGHAEPDTEAHEQFERPDPALNEIQEHALNMILETADRMTANAGTAAAGNADQILIGICAEGSEHLESIRKFISSGIVPDWYEIREGEDE